MCWQDCSRNLCLCLLIVPRIVNLEPHWSPVCASQVASGQAAQSDLQQEEAVLSNMERRMQQLSTDFNATASQASGLLGFFGIKTQAAAAPPAAADRGSGGNRNKNAAAEPGGNRSKLAAAASKSKALAASSGGSGGRWY